MYEHVNQIYVVAPLVISANSKKAYEILVPLYYKSHWISNCSYEVLILVSGKEKTQTTAR